MRHKLNYTKPVFFFSFCFPESDHDSSSSGLFTLQMCLSSVTNESRGGRDAVRHIDAPSVNAMICSRWMCKILMWPQGTARLPALPQWRCLNSPQEKYFDCKWVFYTLLIYFNSQNCCCCSCCCPKQLSAVSAGAEFLFGAAAAFPHIAIMAVSVQRSRVLLLRY